jgi:hypothetical protein
MQGFGSIIQHGYIVDDVEETALDWAQRLGVGPFYVLDRILMEQYYFRGVRMDVELRLGFGYWNGIQIELIQQLNDSDSLYRRAAPGADGATGEHTDGLCRHGESGPVLGRARSGTGDVLHRAGPGPARLSPVQNGQQPLIRKSHESLRIANKRQWHQSNPNAAPCQH